MLPAMVTRRPVVLDLTGEGSHTVQPWLSRLFWIGPTVPPGQPGCVVDREQRLNWTALDAVTPPLSDLIYDGADPALVDYLRERPHVRRVTWTPAPLTEVDLRGTRVEGLTIHHGGGRLTVRLGDAVAGLGVQGSTAGLTVDASRVPSLSLNGIAGPATVDGLDHVIDLNLYRCTDLRLARLVGHATVRSLRICECPVLDIEELARFRSLHHLTIQDCYDVDATRLPGPDALPGLRELRIDGVRQETAAAVGERWHGHPALSVARVRSEQWLLKNQDNPFREWADEELPHARAASTAWNKAVTALGKVPPDDEAGAVGVLREFVARFNALDRKEGLDTTQVEDVGAAVDRLTDLHATLRDRPALIDRFDEWREF